MSQLPREASALCLEWPAERAPRSLCVCVWGGLPIPSRPHLKGGPTIPQSSGQNPLQPPPAQAPGLS